MKIKLSDEEKERVAKLLNPDEKIEPFEPFQSMVDEIINQQMKDKDLIYKVWINANGERIEQETSVTSLQDLIDRLKSVYELEQEVYNLRKTIRAYEEICRYVKSSIYDLKSKTTAIEQDISLYINNVDKYWEWHDYED